MLRVTAGFLALAFLAGNASGQPLPRKPTPIPSFRIEKLCRIRDDGTGRCITRADLDQRLPPDFMAKLQQLFADLYGDLGLDKAKKGLTGCGHDDWAAFAVPTGSGAAASRPAGRRTKGLDLGVASDVSTALGACRQSVAARAGLSDLGPNADYRSWVDRTVSQIDRQVANCRDSGNPMIAAEIDHFESQRLRLNFGWDHKILRDRGLTNEEIETVAQIERAVKHREDEIAAEEAEAKKIKDPVERQKALDQIEKEKSFLDEFVNDFIKDVLDFWTKIFHVPPPPPTDVASAPAPSGGSTASRPCPPDADCKPSCSDTAAAWARFKQTCEMSQWQAYNCVAFLRQANHCVDMTRAHIGPDGDFACYSRPSNEEARRFAYLQQCRKKGWIMQPVPGTTPTCVAPDLSRSLPAKMDICTDPRAMPSEDQCTGPSAPIAPDRPGPQPQPRPDGR